MLVFSCWLYQFGYLFSEHTMYWKVYLSLRMQHNRGLSSPLAGLYQSMTPVRGNSHTIQSKTLSKPPWAHQFSKCNLGRELQARCPRQRSGAMWGAWSRVWALWARAISDQQRAQYQSNALLEVIPIPNIACPKKTIGGHWSRAAIGEMRPSHLITRGEKQHCLPRDLVYGLFIPTLKVAFFYLFLFCIS